MAQQGSRNSLLQEMNMNLGRNRTLGGGSTTDRPKVPLNIKNVSASNPRTGDAVSDDDGETGDDGGNSSANDDDDDMDDEDSDSENSDVPSLPGAQRFHAGLHSAGKLDDMSIFDEQAVTGAIDDDDYDVESMSDSEDVTSADGIKQVRLAVEQDLIQEFENEEESLLRLEPDMNEDPFGNLSSKDAAYQEILDGAEGAFAEFKTQPTNFETEWARIDGDLDQFQDDSLAAWRTTDNTVSGDDNARTSDTHKKVRFEAPPSRTSSFSSSGSEDDDANAFPDLFDRPDEQTPRATILRMDIDGESEYDLEEPGYATSDEMSDSDFDSDTNNDEDDGGNTTEEEDDETLTERLAEIRKAQGKEPPTPTKSVPSTPAASKRLPFNAARECNKTATPNNSNAGKPKLGTFTRDPTRATVVAHPDGSGIKVTCPTNPPEVDREFWDRQRRAIRERNGPSNDDSWTYSTTPIPGVGRRLTARATLGNNFGGNWGFLQQNDIAGLTASSHRQVDQNGFMIISSLHSTSSSATFDEDYATASEGNDNFDDFFHMDSYDSEAEAPTPEAPAFSPAETETTNDWAAESSPMNRQDSSISRTQYIPQPGSVSSFRNNQNFARHVSSLPSNPQRRAQMSEYNAVQKNRRGAANTPMTPARKKRVSQEIYGAGIRKVGNNSPLVSKHRRRSRGSSLSGANLQATLGIDPFGSGSPRRK